MADDAGTVTATPPQTDAPPTDQQGPTSWASAATPPAAAPPPATNPALTAAQNPDRSQAQATTSTANGQIASEDAGPLLVMRPKRGGMLGVIDKMADAMTGVTRPDIYTDQKGNEYVYHPNLSRGQQWARIGADVARGAASGFAAGRGAGGEGRAALAGFQVGDQEQAQRKGQEDEIQGKVKQDMADKASMQMMQMKMAEESWKATRMQREADQNDVKFNDYQVDRIKGDGGHWIADAAHPGDIAGILKVQPDVMKHLVQTGQLRIVDKINPATMQHEGIQAFMMPESHGKDWLPPGTVGHKFDPMAGEIKPFNYSDGVSQGQRDLDDTTAAAALKAYNNDKQEQQDKETTRKNVASETTARDQKLPLEERKLKAETAGEEARTNEAKARTDKIKTGQLNPDGTQNPRFEAMAQALYDGDILPKDLKREAKGAGLDPNELMGRAVEIGQAKGQPWSESIIEQENKFAGNEKTQAALDGINRIIDPAAGYMAQMMKTAKDADLSTHGLYNSIDLAIRRTSGETTAKNFNTSVTELRRSIAGLVGNPLLGGSETDKKLEQADGLIGERPTLENLQSAADLLNKALGTQKSSIIGNNRFLARRYGATAPPPAAPAPTPGPGTAAPAAVKIIPGEPQIKMVDGSIGVARNGQWVKAQP